MFYTFFCPDCHTDFEKDPFISDLEIKCPNCDTVFYLDVVEDMFAEEYVVWKPFKPEELQENKK